MELANNGNKLLNSCYRFTFTSSDEDMTFHISNEIYYEAGLFQEYYQVALEY